MIKTKLLYYEILNYDSENIALLNEHFEVLSLPDPSYDTPEILLQAGAALAPLGYYFGKEKMDACPNLKVIGSNTTGHPHIDVQYAAKLGIRVITLKEDREFLETITPTAELTFGLVIAVTRNIFPAFFSVLEGRWERWPFGAKSMLSRMSLGIAGYGRLGKMVGKYGLSFGMEVCYFDPDVKEESEGAKRVDSLEELVEKSDIVTIHIPHKPETEKLFDRAIFSRFKKGAYLINTSRGELVDNEALLECLRNGQLAGAAVDVLDEEFEPEFKTTVLEHPLVRYASRNPNLIITPHIGGSTKDAWHMTQEYTIRKIVEVFE
jgi:D-3-phosphoglycerate dehydrogenase